MIFDFHTVPLRTRVGPCFALAGIFFFVNGRTTVQGFPAAPVTTTDTPFIKGILIQDKVRIFFTEPTQRFVLYCIEDSSATIRVGTSLTTIAVETNGDCDDKPCHQYLAAW